MQPKPKAQPMHGAAHKQLGQRITLANGPHHRTTRVFREVVHYNSASAPQRCRLESRHLSDTDAITDPAERPFPMTYRSVPSGVALSEMVSQGRCVRPRERRRKCIPNQFRKPISPFCQ